MPRIAVLGTRPMLGYGWIARDQIHASLPIHSTLICVAITRGVRRRGSEGGKEEEAYQADQWGQAGSAWIVYFNW